MKLIAVDLDGTLLSDDCSISLVNREAIYEAQKQGNIVVISSGRSFHDTKRILQNAGLECPFISGNGAISFHTERMIQNFSLPVKVVSEIMGILDETNLYYEIYTRNGILIKRDGRDLLNKEIEKILEQETAFSVKWAKGEIDIQYKQYGLLPVPHYREIDFTQLEVYKLFVLSFDKSKLTKLQGRLSGRKDLSLTSSGVTKIEIGPLEISKGNALKFMADYLGIPLKDSVAIGDNLNDLSMFNIAGMGIAMGNAVDEVKKKSTFITKRHNEDGVAFALRKYILN
ncbi:Cof-type HAD-IIB family hydrolase [Cytobacillus firmus]|uniref:Cof-type HAD-IIB family hydrolase n=1 Tax=Cytobacillus firmus TaxID=1399 RepID=UPI001C8D447D|nr:Cof-type HAD-IIB family hydrolase [Cytobacillus firmus]MBX9975098.1 HAD family phosphatase [Cytobacillus firmus]